MARHLRVEYSGAIYHVTCRMLGDSRSQLFKDDKDKERFLDRLAGRVEQYNIRLYMFVLMTNHFHLVFETPEGNCSKFMQSLSTAYTVYYNLRHHRHGHLFDGRYKAKVVDGDGYLLALSRYVHLNPVQVGGVKDKPIKERMEYLRSYQWSSYPGYIGKRKQLDFVTYDPLLAEMNGAKREWAKQYRGFVEGGLADNDIDFHEALKESPRSIGSDSFRVWIDELYQRILEKQQNVEDASFRHVTEPLSVETILQVSAEVFSVDVEAFRERRRSSPLRAVAAQALIRFGGQTQRQTAVALDMGTGGAVSAQVRRLPGLLAKDRSLSRKMKLLEKKLKTLRKEHAECG